MKSRLAVLGAVAVLAASPALAGPASAATSSAVAPARVTAPATGGITSNVPCTIHGIASTCRLAVTGFKVVDGALQAVGTVTGGGVTAPFQAPVQASGSCRILDLVLGPLHVDLLGLVVDLNQVHLDITAQQGSGNLLGNLLCAVTHLLDNPGNNTNALQRIAGLLNQILGRL